MRNNPRFWLIGGMLFVLMVGFAGWMLVVNPVYGAVSQTREEVDATDRKTESVMAQTRQLPAPNCCATGPPWRTWSARSRFWNASGPRSPRTSTCRD